MAHGKDGEAKLIPHWNGDPMTFAAYENRAKLYIEGTKWNERCLCGPRLAGKLTDATASAVEGLQTRRPGCLNEATGAAKLLKYLFKKLCKLVVPDFGNHLETFFFQVRRRRNEGMAAWCIRFRRDYDQLRKVLKRLRENEAPEKTPTPARPTPTPTPAPTAPGSVVGDERQDAEEATAPGAEFDPWASWAANAAEPAAETSPDKNEAPDDWRGWRGSSWGGAGWVAPPGRAAGVTTPSSLRRRRRPTRWRSGSKTRRSTTTSQSTTSSRTSWSDGCC